MVEEAKEAGEKVGGAFKVGYDIGTKIDQATGASDKLSTAAVAADPELAVSASKDWDDAQTAWDKGDHVDSVGDGVSAAGKFIEGSAEAAWDKLTDII